jgi:hypothetical protein
MQVIDVEALNSPRYAQPQISFRRTEADRRPSRPFVRPNDTAPTWEEREAESARRLHAITVKRVEAQRVFTERLDAPKTYARPVDVANAERIMCASAQTERRALDAILKGAGTFQDLVSAGVCSLGNARRVGRRLEARGHILLELVAREGRSATVQYHLKLTQAGVDRLAGDE